jgi:hypothetical protein
MSLSVDSNTADERYLIEKPSSRALTGRFGVEMSEERFRSFEE